VRHIINPIEKYGTAVRQSAVKQAGNMDISEEQIRIRAYQLWEMAGRPFVEDDRFWREAESELKFLQARDEIRDHR
jgi:hypothetical protein